MRKLLSNIQVVTLATGLALGGIGYAGAAPGFVPAAPAAQSDVVPVIDSKIVRRNEADHDGHSWKKRRHHRDSMRTERRHHDKLRVDRRQHNDGLGAHRPRATPKFAYDAYGNLRIYDGKRWDRDGRDWDGRGRWHHNRDWDKKKRKYPRIINNMNSFDLPRPGSPAALDDILTAVPENAPPAQ